MLDAVSITELELELRRGHGALLQVCRDLVGGRPTSSRTQAFALLRRPLAFCRARLRNSMRKFSAAVILGLCLRLPCAGRRGGGGGGGGRAADIAVVVVVRDVRPSSRIIKNSKEDSWCGPRSHFHAGAPHGRGVFIVQ